MSNKTQLGSNPNLKNSVQVFCRLKPLSDEAGSCIKLISSTTVSLSSESRYNKKECNYVFRNVFTSYSGQQEVFDHVAIPLLEDLVSGKNGLLFTYGVTGSGKTYTLTGEPAKPGIMPRCINTLFNTIGDFQTQKFLIKSDKMNGFELQTEEDALEDRFMETKSGIKHTRTLRKGTEDVKNCYKNEGTKISNIKANCKYAVFVSYIEIYNNSVYDLLDEGNGRLLQAKIIREDPQKNMYVNGVFEIEVKSSADAFELFFIGQKRKRMAHTNLNAESSRSHSIFNIRVVQLEETAMENPIMRIGQLSLVDLAGSERSNRTKTTGMRLKEASSINNSLMTLRTCLDLLRENQLTGGNKLVPYRDSRLTLLFKNYFEGEGEVRMIVCINPSEQDSEENVQVLKFAEMTQDVKILKAETRNTPYTKTPKSKLKPTPKTICGKSTHKIRRLRSQHEIPSITLNMENPEVNEAIIDLLIETLQSRKSEGETKRKEFIEKEESFRKRLTQLNQEIVLSRSEIGSLKAIQKKEQNRNHNLNIKISDVESENTSLRVSNKKLEEVIQSLTNAIDEQKLKINQHRLEKEKNKKKLVVQSQKIHSELDAKLRRQREQLEAQMQAKDSKLQKVKEFLNADTISVPNYPIVDAPEIETHVIEKNHSKTAAVVTPACSRHRRSRSAGEIWLEHNVVKPVALGTVMQPSMRKRKSVTQLKKASDVTNPRQNKYCLIAQERDIDGETETKLYKADILSTCGGGAQVIFNDVECLKQLSPTGTPSSNNQK